MTMDKFLIWGTGTSADRLMKKLKNTTYEKYINVIGFVDNRAKTSESKRIFWNRPVYSPEQIEPLNFDYIDIRSVYEDEIRKQIIEELHLSEIRIKDCFYRLKEKLIQKYESNQDQEMKETIEIIKNKSKLEVFNYIPIDNIERRKKAYYDSACDLYYVDLNGKRLYLKRNYPISTIDNQKYAVCFWDEQDSASPHRYLQGEIQIRPGDVVVDAGAAEASLSLENIDKISKLYLIESSAEWIEALRKTFAPYIEKVVFCKKYLSGINDDTHITLDKLLEEESELNFLKMDIEGAEIDALKHGEHSIKKSKNFRCAICSYHRHGDEENITNILKECKCKISVSKGYMFFMLDQIDIIEPELRRGIVRGIK